MTRNLDLTKLTPSMFNADHASGSIETLAARDGGPIADRAELLKQLAAGELVELQISYTAFVQDKKSNRNFLRFTDAALAQLAETGAGMPLIRDHLQGDLSARAGTITKSELVERGGRSYINQTATVTAPWAVEALLRGNMDRFSIGFSKTGPVLCSACKTEALTKCYHFPGDQLRDDKGKKLGTVEYVFTAADMIECSAVSVPAVPAARIKEIRAALSAQIERREMEHDKEDPILDHAATAGAVETPTAVDPMLGTRLSLVETQLAESTEANAELLARLAAFEAEAKKRDEDQFIELAKREGKLNEKLEASFRALFKASPDIAKQHLEASPRVNPVGAPTLANTPFVDGDAVKVSARDACASNGGNYDSVKHILSRLKVKVTDEQITRLLTGEN